MEQEKKETPVLSVSGGMQDTQKQLEHSITQVSRAIQLMSKRIQAFQRRLAPLIPDIQVPELLTKIADIAHQITTSEAYVELSKTARRIHILYYMSSKLANNQFVVWEYLDEASSYNFIESENTDEWLLLWCEANDSMRITEAIDLCARSPRIEPYSTLFSQSILAYERGHFSISILGLFSAVDGLLSDISKKHNETRIKERAKAIFEKVENNENLSISDYGYLCFHMTFEKTYETLCESSEFSKQEPELLNRHWIMHGRSRRMITKLDCIKIIRFIYALILLDEIGSDDTTDKQTKEKGH